MGFCMVPLEVIITLVWVCLIKACFFDFFGKRGDDSLENLKVPTKWANHLWGLFTFCDSDHLGSTPTQPAKSFALWEMRFAIGKVH